MKIGARIPSVLASRSWAEAYRDLAEGLAAAQSAPLTLCGMSACTDARIDLGKAKALFATDDPGAKHFADCMRARAGRGEGGEIRVEWDEGPRWLATNERIRYALGGTGPQAAWTLAVLGAPALTALEDRSAHMTAQVFGDILLVEDGQLRPASQVAPRGQQRPDVFIFEYTQGVAAGGVLPPRSSRIIVRFSDLGLEQDEGFYALTPGLAAEAGAGLVSGFNCVPPRKLRAEIDRVFSLTAQWRQRGLKTIHLELAGYDTPSARDSVLASSVGGISSLGMSHSEFLQLKPHASDLPSGLVEIGERLGLSRVCVHADNWATAATRDDPELERTALMAGCLLASARAAAGKPVRPNEAPAGARFGDAPSASLRKFGNWTFVGCPAPHLARPSSTLGLGDTFTAGCLLVLGESQAPRGPNWLAPSLRRADKHEPKTLAGRY